MKREILTLAIGLLSVVGATAQSSYRGRLSLEEAIAIAHQSSPSAQMAELSFMSQYWSFRSYKAELLPSINLNGEVGNYNRSIVDVRNSESGEINYVANNTLYNDLSLSIDQQIALTGGTLSLNTSLARLDQFDYGNQIYNSTPINISYTQPLRSFNSLKWQKQSAPLEYEQAKRNYLETIETITINTTNYFFAVLKAQTNLQNNIKNSDDTERMYQIAKRRFEIGTITKSELLQLELSLINSKISTSSSRIALDVATFNLKLYMGIGDSANIELVAPYSIPDITLDYHFVLDRALTNSSHEVEQQLDQINADKSVAQAKGNRGVQLEFNANLGLSQSAYDLSSVYRDPLDKEIVGLTLSVPIFDWGMSRGEIRMAEAERDVIATQIEQDRLQFNQDILIEVMEFNNQIEQCAASLKAMEIASERYTIMMERFENGGVTVTELNTAQDEMDSANTAYITQLQAYWSSYYNIQKMSLYDFIQKRDINAEFDNIIDNQQ